MTTTLNTSRANQAGGRRFRLGGLRALALAAVVALFGNACATVTRSSSSGEVGEHTWSSKDRTLAAALIASHIVDVGQTMGALKSGLSEGNPLYGSHPSLGRMVATKLAATGLTLWAANRFPALRTRILTTNLVLQVGIVGLNARYVGLKMSF
ncbi:MAG TPA: hypothetical protein VMT19_12050 [Thermoanaerobaculaceae bacterium]|nr:hypothetical protein [Thermoanaerobaculaceae bacterium]